MGVFAKNNMKIKEIGPRWGAHPYNVHLNPPL